MVIQRLIGHQQLQELVPTGPEGSYLRDGVGIVVHGAEPGDAALYLGLNEDICRGKPPLRAGILPLGVADVVDHDSHDAPVAALCLSGKGVGIVGRQLRGRGGGRGGSLGGGF